MYKRQVLGHEGTGEIVKMGKNVKVDSAGKALNLGDKVVDVYKRQNQMSKKMVVMEQCKTLPIGDVWEEYCRQCGVEAEGWFDEIQKYEDEVLSKRA